MDDLAYFARYDLHFVGVGKHTLFFVLHCGTGLPPR